MDLQIIRIYFITYTTAYAGAWPFEKVCFNSDDSPAKPHCILLFQNAMAAIKRFFLSIIW
jgi:hypothetical protein